MYIYVNFFVQRVVASRVSTHMRKIRSYLRRIYTANKSSHMWKKYATFSAALCDYEIVASTKIDR